MSAVGQQGRRDQAVAAFLRQEFGSSVATIIGFIEILIEDARKVSADFIPDLERMRLAAGQLSELIDQLLVPASQGAQTRDPGELRHELRTPLNAVKGYGELLAEEARDSGRQALLQDLEKVIDLADRLLGEIDRMVEYRANAAPSLRPGEIVARVLQTIKPLGGPEAPDQHVLTGRILVVDDNASNRDLLSRRLIREGHTVTTAKSGAEALQLAATGPFDLVLLDLMMPEMSGFEVLCRLKADHAMRDIPVIMISALEELDSTVRCIEAGAEDYLAKPFNPVMLRARINASIEKKRLRDREQVILEQLRVEKERSEALLLNILPRTIVDRLRQGEKAIADHIAEATILFSDIVDFTALTARLSAEETVDLLGGLFSQFDDLTDRYGLEKIKTIGDGYMVAGGLPEANRDHASTVASMALTMLEVAAAASPRLGAPIRLRIGIHTGPLVAGVIGSHKFVYDIWGDTVNTAKRMESYGLPGRIHVSGATRQALGDIFSFEARGPLEVKGKGLMETYFLERVR